MLRNRAHDLQLLTAGRLGRRGYRQALPGHLTPTLEEVGADVGDSGTAQAGGCVVPSEPPMHGMSALIEAISTEGGEIDAADEGDLVVDDDELLVMAVQRTLLGVQGAAHLRRRLASSMPSPTAPSRRSSKRFIEEKR